MLRGGGRIGQEGAGVEQGHERAGVQPWGKGGSWGGAWGVAGVKHPREIRKLAPLNVVIIKRTNISQ